MEPDQLFQNSSAVKIRHPDLLPFDMGVLREAFKMRGTTATALSYVRANLSLNTGLNSHHLPETGQSGKPPSCSRSQVVGSWAVLVYDCM